MEKINLEEIGAGHISVKNQGGYSCEVARSDSTGRCLYILAEKINEIIDLLSAPVSEKDSNKRCACAECVEPLVQ